MLSRLQESEAVRLTLQQLPAFALFVIVVGALVVLARRIPASRRRDVLRWAFYAAVVIAVSGIVTDAFVRKWSFEGDSPRFGLVAMIDATAARPFVYRRLSPLVIKYGAEGLERVTPDGFQRWLVESSPLAQYRQEEKPGASGIVANPGQLESWDGRKALLYHVTFFFVFLCNCGTILLARALIRTLVPGEQAFADFAPVIGLLLLPVTFVRGGFFYDASELMLLTAYTLCLARANLLMASITFVLAVLNKESNLLLAPIGAAALYARAPFRRWSAHVAFQAIAGVLIVAAYRYFYRDNPGINTELWLPGNVVFWTDVRSYFLGTDPFAPLIFLPRASSLLGIALVAGLVTVGWGTVPAWVKRAFLTSLVFMIPLQLAFSWRDEVRNLSIVFPFLFVLGAMAVRRLYGSERQQPERQQPERTFNGAALAVAETLVVMRDDRGIR